MSGLADMLTGSFAAVEKGSKKPSAKTLGEALLQRVEQQERQRKHLEGLADPTAVYPVEWETPGADEVGAAGYKTLTRSLYPFERNTRTGKFRLAEPLLLKNLDFMAMASAAKDDLEVSLLSADDGTEAGRERRREAAFNLAGMLTLGAGAIPAKAGTLRMGLGGMAKRGPDTPEFKRWFGDSAVKAPDGRPLTVYHGSPYVGQDDIPTDFAFETGRQPRTAEPPSGHFYFTNNREYADSFAENGNAPLNVHLRMERPFDLRADEARDSLVDALRPSARNSLARERFGGDYDDWIDADGNDINPLPPLGRDTNFWDWATEVSEKFGDGNANKFVDAIVEWADGDGVIFSDGNRGVVGDSFVVKQPTQIKSVNNRGTYGINDPNIMRMGGGAPMPVVGAEDEQRKKAAK